jgi:hypothetical protein
MLKSRSLKRWGYIFLVSVLTSTLLSVLVPPAAKAAVPITTYPATKVRNILETQAIASSTYVATNNTIFTTSNKNLFKFSPTQVAYSPFVQITGMVNDPATCNIAVSGSFGANLADGYNSPYDGINITSISASAGIVTYTTNAIQGAITGEQITISGASTAGFNGTFTINSTNGSTTISVINPATGASSSAYGKHYTWERIYGATDYTFTVARNPNASGQTCTATTNGGSRAVSRDTDNIPQLRTSNMATDATGATIFMASGSRWPTQQTAEGELYVSRNSGSTFTKVDLMDTNGISIGNTTISNPYNTAGYNTLYGCQHRTCMWNSISVSADGQVVAATSLGGEFVYSTDGGYHWTEVQREKYGMCAARASIGWQQVAVSKNGNKIIASLTGGVGIFVLDTTKSNILSASPLWPPGNSGCGQGPYYTTTNPAIYGSTATDKSSAPIDLQTSCQVYALGTNQNGNTLVIACGQSRIVICKLSSAQITSCRLAPDMTFDNSTSIAWSATGIGNTSSVYVSNSGQYITIGTFSNLQARSEDYGATFQQFGTAYTRSNGGSSTNVSDCNNPEGIISIAGSDNGQVQVFVTQNSTNSYTSYNVTPGVCKSTNYGRKNSWVSVPVSMYAGDSTDISRKQVWSSVVLGSTGAPMYMGSYGVSQYYNTTTPCNSTYVLYCSPFFWSSFGVTGPESLATPVGTAISGQFYSTVNPPSGQAATITWALGKTSDGSSVSGITITSSGTLQVSTSVPVGVYGMTITGTDNGTSASIDMLIYVYDPNRSPPTFDTPVSTSDGYTVNVTNYDPLYNYYSFSDTGTVTPGTPSGSTLPLTVTGIAPSSAAVVTTQSFMGTVVTTQYSILSNTVTGYSTGPQTPLYITSEPTVAAGGSRTLTTSGGSGGGSVTYAITTAGNAGCSISGSVLSVTSVTAGNTCGVTATKAANGSYLSISSSEQTITVKTAGLIPLFDAPVRTSAGYTVHITNYSASYTWTITTSAGSISVSSPSGSVETITITSLSGGTSATVTASTTRTNYSSETSTVTAAALKALTIQASSPSFYSGNSVTETYTASALLVGDTITSMTFTFIGTGSTSYGPNTTMPTAVGTYRATPSAAVFGVGSASNYLITYIYGDITITVDPAFSGGSIIITVSDGTNKATYITITARAAYPGRVALLANNRKIAGCTSIPISSVATCRWRPSTHGAINLVGILTPTDNANPVARTSLQTVAGRRVVSR